MKLRVLAVRRVALVWLVLALLGAQTLGLLHQIAHGAGPVHAVGQGGAPAAVEDGDALARLFAGHVSGKDCRLYDQLSHSDLLCAVPAAVLPAPLPGFVLRVLQGDFVARRAALFDARGPPSLR